MLLNTDETLEKAGPIVCHIIPWVIILLGPISKVLLHPEAEMDHRSFALLVTSMHLGGFYSKKEIIN